MARLTSRRRSAGTATSRLARCPSLGTPEYRPAANLVACRNGILNLETRQLLPHDPLFFTTDCLPLDYDANAPKPERWLQFLEELWPGDGKDFDMEAESTLQDMFGYLLTPDTRHRKSS